MRTSIGGRLVRRLAEVELAQVIAEHALLIGLLALVALLALAAAGSKAQDLLDKLGRGLPPIATSAPGNRAPAGQMPASPPKVAANRTPAPSAPAASREPTVSGAAEAGHAAGDPTTTSEPRAPRPNAQAPAQEPGGHARWTSAAGSVAVRADTTLRAEGN